MMNRVTGKRVLRRGMEWAAWAGLSLMCTLCTLCTCTLSTLSTDGGGSRGGNPVVAGTIAGPDGAGAWNVRVSLIAKDYNPMTDTPPQPSSTDTTDSLGSFLIAAPDTGWYNVEAVGIIDGARSMRFNVKAVRDSVLVLPVDTLHRPGVIRVPLPEGNDAPDGYMYVPGTSIAAWLAGAPDTVVLDSVPAGTLPVLYYAQKSSTERKAIRYAIAVRSDETTLIGNPQWSHCRRICLNTSSSGASVSGDVYGFPVLVRLTESDFRFSQAQADGRDLRFTKTDATSLPFEIERWDAAGYRAEIWVKIDTVFGNDSNQSITMYWGNPAAPMQSESGMVFDTADGFQGVWHLGDAAGDSVRDATVNRYHGISPDTARPSVIEGTIGNCREFDGNRDYITVPNTAAGKLDFPQNGRYAVSVWVMADTFTELPQTVVSKGKYQYRLLLHSKSWQFFEYQDGAGWDLSAQKANLKQWVLLTGVRDGATQHLYINGELTDSVGLWLDTEPRKAGTDFIIGRSSDGTILPNNKDESNCFSGRIDEVRVCSTVPGIDWIKLCYMNQRNDDRLVIFKY